MTDMENRYCFDAFRRYFWKDIRKPWFWRMCGVRQTLAYIWRDTVGGCDG